MTRWSLTLGICWHTALIESDAEGIGGSGFVECLREHIHSVRCLFSKTCFFFFTVFVKWLQPLCAKSLWKWLLQRTIFLCHSLRLWNINAEAFLLLFVVVHEIFLFDYLISLIFNFSTKEMHFVGVDASCWSISRIQGWECDLTELQFNAVKELVCVT